MPVVASGKWLFVVSCRCLWISVWIPFSSVSVDTCGSGCLWVSDIVAETDMDGDTEVVAATADIRQLRQCELLPAV